MALFVGLDVSLKTTSVCSIKADGKVKGRQPVSRCPGQGAKDQAYRYGDARCHDPCAT